MVDNHPTIRDLIEDRKRVTAWSYQALSDASGGSVSRQTMFDLGTKPPKSWPSDPNTILGLARALNVPEETIVLGYAASFGIPLRGQPSLLALQLPASTDLLTAAERTHIVGLVNSLTAGRQHPPTGGDDDDASPDSTEDDSLNTRVSDAARSASRKIRRTDSKRETG
ncbi:immunity repressor [Gordonia phage Mulch]|uniref:Immunity repressor n=5 Tax=Betterkatzvirus betterkatz TaxID=2560485 RepID=A0A2Z5HEP4_9CAUD|nr:immunity repressor [Gordonia phage Nadeem]AZS11208.1 immunity repressor [Gordonia phage WheatThin]QAU06838.1 immunity repressor [Gordonia phage Brylie]QAX92536.1 immunity repressor [Gordonia phage Mulch]QAY06497.1 immunity repressor [Gordonia phage Parada]